jgi:hypothetical protein
LLIALSQNADVSAIRASKENHGWASKLAIAFSISDTGAFVIDALLDRPT